MTVLATASPFAHAEIPAFAISQSLVQAAKAGLHDAIQRVRAKASVGQLDVHELTELRRRLVELGENFDLKTIDGAKHGAELDRLADSLERLWIKAGGSREKFLALPELQLDDPKATEILKAFATEQETFDASSAASRLRDEMNGNFSSSPTKQYGLYLAWRGLLKQLRKIGDKKFAQLSDYDLMQAVLSKNASAKTTQNAQLKVLSALGTETEEERLKVAGEIVRVYHAVNPKIPTSTDKGEGDPRTAIVFAGAISRWGAVTGAGSLDQASVAGSFAFNKGSAAPTKTETRAADKLKTETEEFSSRLHENLKVGAIAEIATMFKEKDMPESSYLDMAAAAEPELGRQMIAAVQKPDGKGGYLLDVGDLTPKDGEKTQVPTAAGDEPVIPVTRKEVSIVDLAKRPDGFSSGGPTGSLDPTTPTRWAYQNPDDALTAARARLNAGSSFGLGESRNDGVFRGLSGAASAAVVAARTPEAQPPTPTAPPTSPELKTPATATNGKEEKPNPTSDEPRAKDGVEPPVGPNKLGGREFQDNLAARVTDHRPSLPTNALASFGAKPTSDLSKQLEGLKARANLTPLSAPPMEAAELPSTLAPRPTAAAARPVIKVAPKAEQIVPVSALNEVVVAPVTARPALTARATSGIAAPPVGGSWLGPMKDMFSGPVAQSIKAAYVSKRVEAPAAAPVTVAVTTETEETFDKDGKLVVGKTTTVQTDRKTKKPVKTTKKTTQKLSTGNELRQELVELVDPKSPDEVRRTETMIVVDKDENVVSRKVTLLVLGKNGIPKTREERTLTNGPEGKLQVVLVITTYDERGTPARTVRRIQPLEKGEDIALPSLEQLPVASL